MFLFMVAADGLQGVFFFTFFFGAPAALLIGAVSYAILAPRLRREPPIARWLIIVAGALLGALLFPPVWIIHREGSNWFLQHLGPALLGAGAGVAGALAFFAIGIRQPPPEPPAA
jgi:hypothetical protein